jgi:tetratricopeptide (TPR) repeat protein
MTMRIRSSATCLVLVAGLGVALSGCAYIDQVRAKKASKDGHNLYRGQDWRAAAEKYEEAIQLNPDDVDVYFFLGNAYDNMYRPARKGEAQNDGYLTKAIDNYKIAAQRHQDPLMKRRALEYLVAAYGADKLNDPTQAEPVVRQMIELDPQDAANYFVLADIYEDSGEYETAEQIFLKAKEIKPNDPAVHMQLAGFYNRQGDFDKTIAALNERIRIEPNNPEAHYTVATYYWDKAYRDFRLNDKEKLQYVLSGLEAVDKAIQIKPDYMEAVAYKNLLLRLQANLEKDPARQQALLREADQLRDRAEELRKQKAAGAS